MDKPLPIDPSAADAATERVLLEVAQLARRFAKGVVRREDVEDVAQEVVLECLIKLRNGYWVPGETSTASLVRNMIHRRGVDRLRRAQRRDEREADHCRDLRESVHAWMSPAVAMEERELNALHDRALAELPPLCRRAYVLVREEGLSYSEVARRLGVTRHAVTSHVTRAQQRLKRSLRAHGVATPRRSRNGRVCEDSVSAAALSRRGR
jgi:RNA polymerase sigma factor (sigma-70 family)